MRETVAHAVGVKAAGGIRDLETALAMLEAGADASAPRRARRSSPPSRLARPAEPRACNRRCVVSADRARPAKDETGRERSDRRSPRRRRQPRPSGGQGARKPGSKLAARVEPGVVLDLLSAHGKSLQVVQEAPDGQASPGAAQRLRQARRPRPCRGAPEHDRREGQSEPRHLRARRRHPRCARDRRNRDPSELVTAFVLKAMAMHGYRPELTSCTACGGDVARRCPSRSSRWRAMRLVRTGRPCRTSSAAQALRWLDAMLRSTMAELAETDIPPAAVVDCFDAVRAFVAYHLPARLQGARLLRRDRAFRGIAVAIAAARASRTCS